MYKDKKTVEQGLKACDFAMSILDSACDQIGDIIESFSNDELFAFSIGRLLSCFETSQNTIEQQKAVYEDIIEILSENSDGKA